MNNWIYIAVMFAVSYAIRILPLTLIRKPIENQFIQSFLYYVPYVTLAVMTFPAIVNATQSPIAGAAALVVGIIAAWMGAGLFPVSVLCCAVVLVLEFFLVRCHLTGLDYAVPGRLSFLFYQRGEYSVEQITVIEVGNFHERD